MSNKFGGRGRLYVALVYGDGFGPAVKIGVTRRPIEYRREEHQKSFGHCIILWSEPGDELTERRTGHAFQAHRVKATDRHPSGWTECVRLTRSVLHYVWEGLWDAINDQRNKHLETDLDTALRVLAWALKHIEGEEAA